MLGCILADQVKARQDTFLPGTTPDIVYADPLASKSA